MGRWSLVSLCVHCPSHASRSAWMAAAVAGSSLRESPTMSRQASINWRRGQLGVGHDGDVHLVVLVQVAGVVGYMDDGLAGGDVDVADVLGEAASPPPGPGRPAACSYRRGRTLRRWRCPEPTGGTSGRRPCRPGCSSREPEPVPPTPTVRPTPRRKARPGRYG